jgi:hypothetical protein
MSSRWRRFEVLLPLRFNDGREVPGEWIAESVLESMDHFGATNDQVVGSSLYRLRGK